MLVAYAQIELYQGQGDAGYERVSSTWGELSRNLVFRVQNIHLEALHLRARCAVAATKGDRSPAMLADAAKCARKLERSGVGWANAAAHVLNAAIACKRGEVRRAIDVLDLAERLYKAEGMTVFEAAVAYRRGQLRGAEGASEVDRTEKLMRDKGIVEPARFLDVVAPGFASS
jgi:hypothetical protein